MISYATIGTNDIAKAQGFYDPLFAEIGVRRLMEISDHGGFTLYGDTPGAGSVAVTHPWDGNAATVGNGNMLALQMKDRSTVDAMHAKALALGATCDGAPGLRGEEGSQAFYGAYFRDLDGNKLCVFKMGPA